MGELYKMLARHQTYQENYRYQSEYEDKLIARLFTFNMVNFYGPMTIKAFVGQSYDGLFVMMLVQMGFKQFL